LGPLALPFLPFSLELLLQLDDLMSELFDFLLVDMREIVYMRVVELLNRLCQLCIDVDELLKGAFEGKVLFVKKPVLLLEVFDVG
jgi:hypothetical protein